MHRVVSPWVHWGQCLPSAHIWRCLCLASWPGQCHGVDGEQQRMPYPKSISPLHLWWELHSSSRAVWHGINPDISTHIDWEDIKVIPATHDKHTSIWVAVCGGDVMQVLWMRTSGEIAEHLVPKGLVCLASQQSNSQGLQVPLLSHCEGGPWRWDRGSQHGIKR